MSTHSQKYIQHLHSPEWDRLRMRILARANYRCEICRVGNCYLELDHITYERLGQEWDEDVQILCHDCHEQVGRERKAKRFQQQLAGFYNDPPLAAKRVLAWQEMQRGRQIMMTYDQAEATLRAHLRMKQIVARAQNKDQMEFSFEEPGKCKPGCGCC